MPYSYCTKHKVSSLRENWECAECLEDDERDNHRSAAVEQYWKDKQGDEYGSY